MINVTGRMWIWTGESGSWHFITVPEELSGEIRAHAMAELRGFGSVRVEASIHDVSWQTSVFPMKSGGYLLPIKRAVRSKAGITVDDEVTVTLQLL